MYTKSLIMMLLIALPAAVPMAAAPPHELALKQNYDAFVQSLDHRSLAKDYPGAVRNLDSSDPKKQIGGIKTLAATEEVKAIPWIVPFPDSKDRHVRIQAGLSLNTIVATHQLKRRDKSQPEKVVILPPDPGDIDLRPVSWVILKMLRLPDDKTRARRLLRDVVGSLGEVGLATISNALNLLGLLNGEERKVEEAIRTVTEVKHDDFSEAHRTALYANARCRAGEVNIARQLAVHAVAVLDESEDLICLCDVAESCKASELFEEALSVYRRFVAATSLVNYVIHPEAEPKIVGSPASIRSLH